MTVQEFENYCKEKVADWYNRNTVQPSDEITVKDVFTTWLCKTADKKKGLFGIDNETDTHYFEFTQIYEDLIVMDIYTKVDRRDLNPMIPTTLTGNPTILRK